MQQQWIFLKIVFSWCLQATLWNRLNSRKQSTLPICILISSHLWTLIERERYHKCAELNADIMPKTSTTDLHQQRPTPYKAACCSSRLITKWPAAPGSPLSWCLYYVLIFVCYRIWGLTQIVETVLIGHLVLAALLMQMYIWIIYVIWCNYQTSTQFRSQNVDNHKALGDNFQKISDILSAISPPASECKAASVIDSPTNSGVGAGDSGNGSKKLQQENW